MTVMIPENQFLKSIMTTRHLDILLHKAKINLKEASKLLLLNISNVLESKRSSNKIFKEAGVNLKEDSKNYNANVDSEKTNAETVKMLMKNQSVHYLPVVSDSLKNIKENILIESRKEEKNNAASFCSENMKSSPFRFYPTHVNKTEGSSWTPSKDKARKGSNSQLNTASRKSFVNVPNTSTSIKQENQIYVRSLEEFIESNIKCINDLIDYKQSTNFAIIELNARCKSAAVDLEFEAKK